MPVVDLRLQLAPVGGGRLDLQRAGNKDATFGAIRFAGLSGRVLDCATGPDAEDGVMSTMARWVASRDGTRIAFEKVGDGPALVLVGGALSSRRAARRLALRLAPHFTVYSVDRRGRGESTDAETYAVEREIEDLAAMIEEAGGSASLYGVSSGAALALQTAAKLGPAKVRKLALYEPPYRADNPQEKDAFAAQKRRVLELIETGEPGDAAAYFMAAIGTPPEILEKIKRTPEWPAMGRIDFTLAYDYAVLGDGAIPAAVAQTIAVPTLVMDGEKTMDYMHATADRVSALIPGAKRRTLHGQTHQAAPEVVGPELIEFFPRR